MYRDGKILFGKSGEEEVCLDLAMANRHGMIAGATGTGKTVSLKVLAESFSDAGVPVFLADIKGDLGSIAQMGQPGGEVTGRVQEMGLEAEGFEYRSYPAAFWDVYGEKGMPLRTTVTEMGPLLLARALGINDLQTDILNMVFQIADAEGLLLIDTKDLKAMLNHVGDHAKDYSAEYGRITRSSIDAIIRSVVALEAEGADQFFGEPALCITDLLQTDQGRGLISILDCRKLILHPQMYSTMLLWMLSELYETLPEVGDMPKPKLVFFFDEAHMLFDSASKDLLQRIGQTVKLIRSKGVGIFFVTQDPSDIPEDVMGQLGNKIQHALHAYSPKEMKAVRSAAEGFRVNPEFDTEEAIMNLGTGEAVVSFLGEDGIPQVAQRVKVLPPQSYNGACDDSLRDSIIRGSLLYSRYATAVDRDSAYEFLKRMGLQQSSAAEAAQKAREEEKQAAAAQKEVKRQAAAAQREEERRAAAEERAAAREAERQAAAAQREAERQEEAARKAAEKEALAAQKAAEKQAALAQKEAEKAEKQRKAAASRIAKTISGTVGRQVGKSIGQSVGGSFGKTLGGNLGAELGRSILGTLFRR